MAGSILPHGLARERPSPLFVFPIEVKSESCVFTSGFNRTYSRGSNSASEVVSNIQNDVFLKPVFPTFSNHQTVTHFGPNIQLSKHRRPRNASNPNSLEKEFAVVETSFLCEQNGYQSFPSQSSGKGVSGSSKSGS